MCSINETHGLLKAALFNDLRGSIKITRMLVRYLKQMRRVHDLRRKLILSDSGGRKKKVNSGEKS